VIFGSCRSKRPIVRKMGLIPKIDKKGGERIKCSFEVSRHIKACALQVCEENAH